MRPMKRLMSDEQAQEPEDSRSGSYSRVSSLNSRMSKDDDCDVEAVGEVDTSEEEAVVPNEDIEEHMYGMTTCSLVRDFYAIANGVGTCRNRVARISTTLLLLVLCLGMQVFLLSKVKQFVSAKAVHDIRIDYDFYEAHMYSNTTMTVNGNHRGVDGTFEPHRFHTLSPERQQNACRIPLSQPDFFFVVLFIWSLTCMGEFKSVESRFHSLILNTDTVESMRDALLQDGDSDDKTFLISKLTLQVKLMLVLCVFLPRIGIASYLLWLGCRWLLATNNFADLILNAVALEFILCFKETVYYILVPQRNKIDLENTKILPRFRKEKGGTLAFTMSICWGLAAALWVLLYMGVPGVRNGFQQVLPDYKWDLHNECIPWVKWRYCVDPPCPESP